MGIYFTFYQIGIHDVQWISINMVKQSGPEMRKLWLEEIERVRDKKGSIKDAA